MDALQTILLAQVIGRRLTGELGFPVLADWLWWSMYCGSIVHHRLNACILVKPFQNVRSVLIDLLSNTWELGSAFLRVIDSMISSMQDKTIG